jgi:hypothetical protein
MTKLMIELSQKGADTFLNLWNSKDKNFMSLCEELGITNVDEIVQSKLAPIQIGKKLHKVVGDPKTEESKFEKQWSWDLSPEVDNTGSYPLASRFINEDTYLSEGYCLDGKGRSSDHFFDELKQLDEYEDVGKHDFFGELKQLESPTEKQINLIHSLGGTVPASKAEASALITKLLIDKPNKHSQDATAKQVKYLKKLGYDFSNSESLSKSEASKIIDQLVKQKNAS